MSLADRLGDPPTFAHGLDLVPDDRPHTERVSSAVAMIASCEQSAEQAETDEDRALWRDHVRFWRREVIRRRPGG
ncbi:MAG TPA: hypothetical protein VN837_05560 [Chloroflexota bacterium]|nr:hypothetical protein [Chloroflexota bacterium]